MVRDLVKFKMPKSKRAQGYTVKAVQISLNPDGIRKMQENLNTSR